MQPITVISETYRITLSWSQIKDSLRILEDTARYAGLLLAPAEGFGLRPRLFFALRAKKELFMLFWPIFGNFWCLVVIVVTFSGNLSNFERNQKKNPWPKAEALRRS
jgi:hypothetical protein